MVMVIMVSGGTSRGASQDFFRPVSLLNFSVSLLFFFFCLDAILDFLAPYLSTRAVSSSK